MQVNTLQTFLWELLTTINIVNSQLLVLHSEPLLRLYIWYYTLHVHLMNIYISYLIFINQGCH